MVDRERCSKCCEVLTIRTSVNFREWQRYVRRFGYSHLNDIEYPKKSELQIYSMTRQISKRRAKKINPHLIKIVGNNQSYFTCKHLGESGCGNYENRPKMCSEYPYYGKTKDEFFQLNKGLVSEKGLYTDDCTYYIELK